MEYRLVSSRMVWKPRCEIKHIVFVYDYGFTLSNETLDLLRQKNLIGHFGLKNVGFVLQWGPSRRMWVDVLHTGFPIRAMQDVRHSPREESLILGFV